MISRLKDNGSYKQVNCSASSFFQRMQWKSAFTYILWGLTLMMLQVQSFFDYAFLFPAAGILLTFLGFQNLRNENNSFYHCYRLALAALFAYPLYLLSTTLPLFIFSWFQWVLLAFQVFFLLYQLALIFFLRKGLRQIFQQMELKPNGDPLLVLLLWVILQQAIGYTALAGSMIAWVIVSCMFLLCLWILWFQVMHLYHDGYVPQTERSVLSNGWCMGAYALLNSLLMLSGILFTINLYF